jgi:DNA-binding response OmpR family regulator
MTVANSPGAPAENPGARILVVEDDDPLGVALAIVLRRLGFAAESVRNGREALAHLARHPVDLVISDIYMPECDGLELLRELRLFKPRPRFLAMTGGGSQVMPDMLRVARQLGADGTIRKPFEPEQLILQVRELLPERGTAG